MRDEVDCQRWRNWLQRTVETYGWRLHAFVLMPNHDHLFVETPQPNLAASLVVTQQTPGKHKIIHRRGGHADGAAMEDDRLFDPDVPTVGHLDPVTNEVADDDTSARSP